MTHRPLTVAFIPGLDRFEDFHDKIGVSLEAFRTQLTGGWLFNYIKALRVAGIRTIVIYTSARVARPLEFTHQDTGASVFVLPSPLVHKKARSAHERFFPNSRSLAAITSYLSTPLGELVRLLRREHCDAILCQEYEHTRFDTCAFVGRLLRLPVFATFQGGGEAGTTLERIIRRRTIPSAAGLIVPSQVEATRVTRTYGIPTTKIAPIPNPVDVITCGPADRQRVRAELGIGSGTRVVAWHGRVQIRKKGLDTLVDAWTQICAERPSADILLLLVGSGQNVEELRTRLQFSRKVTWIDRYVFDRHELWSYLMAADIYTMPSRDEGFAVAPLEAMACGLPVVASNARGVLDVLPRGEADGGVIVPRENAPALAKALTRLIDDPALASRLGATGRRRVENEFSLEAVGQQLRQLLFGTETAEPVDAAFLPGG
jgi:glycosyltransferase involved in cell wall biosynthesis